MESAPPDTAESSDSSRTHRSHILKPTPERRVERDIRWEVNKLKIHRNDRIIRICATEPERREKARPCLYVAPKSILGDTQTSKLQA